MKNTLICFTGIDGSGKTTIAKEIDQKLRKNNVNSVYVYGRVIPTISRLFMWLVSIYLKKRKTPYSRIIPIILMKRVKFFLMFF